jgi:uncharacterized protein
MKIENILPSVEAATAASADTFDLDGVLHELKHYLPAQAPLKDFIHHNTLHAFQNLPFTEALTSASVMYGYNTYISLAEYRQLYEKKQIKENILHRVINEKFGHDEVKIWKEKLLYHEFRNDRLPRIGLLRAFWKKSYHLDLDSLVHPLLFRLLCSYLDQGVSIWNFPVHHKGLLSSIRELERNSFASFFQTDKARKLLLDPKLKTEELLEIVVGKTELFKQYLFDQQFAHQGWSGMVSAIEDQPESLLDRKNVSMHDLVHLELILEIDALESVKGKNWKPLSNIMTKDPVDLFAPVEFTEYDQVIALWQQAFEWSYYDEVLAGIKQSGQDISKALKKNFQAMFCIDDRECSLRRHLEKQDPFCETFATPGFFGVEFFFKPEHGKFHTKLCPAPVTPKFLIKEGGTVNKRAKDPHFTKHTHTLFGGWLISQTLGFWSALKLFVNIFKPSVNPATATSFTHMDRVSHLSIEANGQTEDNLQVGFTINEMVDRVENLLRSIGLITDFAPIVYMIGHGSSSVNNPHYAAYDCGACSGRPGSVNARVFSFMANHGKVRAILKERGITIPDETQFIGGLHDTTRDEIMFYDESSLSQPNQSRHKANVSTFDKALDLNAKERSRRFETLDPRKKASTLHDLVRERAVSLFQPRPELNHATNALCIIGRRSLTRELFLDRRSFMNSFDYQVDPTGKYLLNILKAAAPVCGGINLEYFFSRVDNQKLGAGTKLPHNVMGLFGVANGIDGDLRPGLPSQMIEVHDPIRLLIIVEHFPGVVLKTIQTHEPTYEWFKNEWVHLVVVEPATKDLYRFERGSFVPYTPATEKVGVVNDVFKLVESSRENIPVHLID